MSSQKPVESSVAEQDVHLSIEQVLEGSGAERRLYLFSRAAVHVTPGPLPDVAVSPASSGSPDVRGRQALARHSRAAEALHRRQWRG